MTSAETLFRQLEDSALSYDEQVRLRCQIAAELEHGGQYEAAHDALAALWRGVGQRPSLEGLTELIAAEVLLRIGTLSGWLGSVRQIEGAQEAAKDLISESIIRFQALNETVKAIAAQSELGFCYWREGAYDEARVIYTEALKGLTDEDAGLKSEILLRLAIVESCSGRYNDALRILTDGMLLFEAGTKHALKGKFHNELGSVLTILSKAERRSDYADRAIIEYTAAAYHFDQADHIGYRARTENNLGFLLYTIGRYADAREHLNRARRLFLNLKDSGSVAQVDETHARVLLAEGRPRVAARVIAGAVRTLSRGGEQGLLAEALTTEGRVRARLGDLAASQAKFRQAADVAEQAGAVEDAGRALLALLEEHGAWLAEPELLTTYERADSLLKTTQDAETIARLRACARQLINVRCASLLRAPKREQADFWTNFSLPKKVRAYEARYIRRALIEAQGSISRAARLLGLKHHATLAVLLQRRHRALAHLRTPAEKRRRSLFRLRGSRHTANAQTKTTRPVRILHVEDNKMVAALVKDMLEQEGWSVETTSEGAAALKQLDSPARFDLLLFDYKLPDSSGLELVRAARALEHRRRTPIIILSASDVRARAERAGADAFLLKPEEIGRLIETIERLLTLSGKD